MPSKAKGTLVCKGQVNLCLGLGCRAHCPKVFAGLLVNPEPRLALMLCLGKDLCRMQDQTEWAPQREAVMRKTRGARPWTLSKHSMVQRGFLCVCV